MLKYNMRSTSCLFLFLILISSCKSKKNLVRVNPKEVKKISAKKIIKKHNTLSFDAKILNAKLKVGYADYSNGKRNKINFTVNLRVLKDSVIWMKGSKIISAFRVKITPTSFSYYSLIDKKYFEGDFSLLEKILGANVTFKQVQSLLLGETVLDLKKQKFISEVDDANYKLTPKKQHELYRVFFLFDPNNYSLKKQLLRTDNNKALDIDYKSYRLIEKQLVPKKIMINVSQPEHSTTIMIDFKSVTLNKQISTPYKIPSSYKPIKL
jgi:hypothetical protein